MGLFTLTCLLSTPLAKAESGEVILEVTPLIGAETSESRAFVSALERELESLEHQGAFRIQHRLNRAQSTARRTRLASAAQEAGAQYVLRVQVTRQAELVNLGSGIHTVFRHRSSLVLINTNSRRVIERVRKKFGNRGEASKAGRRSALAISEALRARTGGSESRHRAHQNHREHERTRLAHHRAPRNRREAETNREPKEPEEGKSEHHRGHHRRHEGHEARREGHEARREGERGSEREGERGHEREGERGGEGEGELGIEGEAGTEEGLAVRLRHFSLHTFIGPFSAQSISAEPRLQINEEVYLFANTSFFYRWSDVAPQPFFDSLNDFALGAGYLREPLEGLEAEVKGAIEFPTSAAARDIDNLFTTFIWGGLEWELGWATPILEADFRKYLPTVNQEEFEQRRETAEEEGSVLPPGWCSTPVNTSCPLLGELPPNYMFGLEFGARFHLLPEHGINIETIIGYEYVQFEEGEHNIEGTIELSFRLMQNFKFAAGILTAQPLLNENDKVAFPFWDFNSSGPDYTTFYFLLAFIDGDHTESERKD